MWATSATLTVFNPLLTCFVLFVYKLTFAVGTNNILLFVQADVVPPNGPSPVFSSQPGKTAERFKPVKPVKLLEHIIKIASNEKEKLKYEKLFDKYKLNYERQKDKYQNKKLSDSDFATWITAQKEL